MMKKFLTSKEAADYLRIRESELQEIVNKGKIPTYKIGGIYIRFKVDDLDSYNRRASNQPMHKRHSDTFLARIGRHKALSSENRKADGIADINSGGSARNVGGRISEAKPRFFDRIKDFFYFNDFYIVSSIAIIIILYLIFK